MKKAIYFISVLAFAFVASALGQKPVIELTFSAQYQSQYVMLDSIYIENLTQGGDTILYAPDTMLVLDYVTGVTSNIALNSGFRVSQNRPNPFAEQTIISIFLPEADHLQVSVINLLGQKVAFFERSVDAGNHSFVFYPGDGRYYILTATANGLTKTIKMVSLNNHSSKQILLNYRGADGTQAGYKSSQDINDFGYSLGDQLRFIGFSKNASEIIGSDVIEATPAGNEEFVFEIIEGIPCPGTPTVTCEGQTYNTVQIGDQCWFKENLNVGTMIPGDQEMTDNSIIEKYCYEDDPANCATYGGLYQWDEMMQYATQQGTQGICPNGWHIPTDTEWTVLTDFLGGWVAGGKMKATGTIEAGTGLWYAPNEGATNSSGFTALPGGWRINYGNFTNMGIGAYFWSSTEYEPSIAWFRYLIYDGPGVLTFLDIESSGFSSRCLKDGIPMVTTSGITNITQTTATSGGEVTGTNVTARGVCWSISQNPTIADSYTSDGNGVGSFVSNLTGLTLNTTYYVRAYAINSVGTAYGNELSFTTLHQPCPGIPTVTYEGQTYNTELIGTQCWFKENLNVGTMINGSQNQTNNSIIEKYCYEDDPANCATYGGLYHWDEMMQYTTQQGSQGICPNGWHIPTDGEWTTLNYFLGGASESGGKMKATGTIETGTGLWFSPNQGATNSSGFTALPGGISNISGGFSHLGYRAYFWSSTEHNPYSWSSWYRVLYYNNANVTRSNLGKTNGFSSRCVQD